MAHVRTYPLEKDERTHISYSCTPAQDHTLCLHEAVPMQREGADLLTW